MDAAPRPRTLYDKVWDAHVVRTYADGADLVYIDRHLVQEVSSPQAFSGLDLAGRAVRRPEAHLAVADHAVPTAGRVLPFRDVLATRQVERLEANAARHAIPYFGIDSARHGIVHVIGPETGFTQPGVTLVCGDSHTSTHGAFGAVAFGIGASECEWVLATQTLRLRRWKTMRLTLDGAPGPGAGVKDVILAVIGRIGVRGGLEHAVEFDGPWVRGLSMEGRMTLCNMAIEAGARIGMVAPDDTTFAYLAGRPWAPAGAEWDAALAQWRALPGDAGAVFDREVRVDVDGLGPMVTWGTTPEESAPVTGVVPDPEAEPDADRRARMRRSLAYMDLAPGARLDGLRIDRVFVGSCTNGRIEDLRAAAAVLRGRKVAGGVTALVVPGSAAVRAQAEAEGLDAVFRDAGFDWRLAGCSMCVGMNEDRLGAGERCASTSNRNFEGRQGVGGRTHLMSPAMAAAAAVAGRITDVRRLEGAA